MVDAVGEIPTLGYFWAAILGAVQGLAEFLPISSSGHLALVEHLGLGMAAPAVFDIFLHLATLLVVLVYFRHTIVWYLRNDFRVLLYVVMASIPTAAIGFAFRKYFEAIRHSPTLICLGLLVTACILLMAEMRKAESLRLRDVGWFGAFVIGLCQALAITPGISRSGSTIAGAMLLGVEREEAFRFSFILSIPAVAGAALLSILSLVRAGGVDALFQGMEPGPLAVGFLVAAAMGFVSLAVLKRLVLRGGLVFFAVYCLFAALAGFIYFNFVR